MSSPVDLEWEGIAVASLESSLPSQKLAGPLGATTGGVGKIGQHATTSPKSRETSEFFFVLKTGSRVRSEWVLGHMRFHAFDGF